MDRIACAYIARYELVLRARSEPAILGRPVAVADLAGPGRLGAVSPVAEALGIIPGQLAASARARCPELEVLAPDPVLVGECEREILTALGTLSPRLDSDRRGGFFLGLGGLERILENAAVRVGADRSRGEEALAARVREVLGALGLPVQVAIADLPLTAWVAARRARPVRIVPPDGDVAVLSGIPLADLTLAGGRLSDPAHELLHLLGLGDVANLAALPPGELARRLGAEGAALERMLANARPMASPREDMVPVQPERAELELDVPTDDLEPLLFLGKSLIDRLLYGLRASRRALAELTIDVQLDDRSRLTHVLHPAEPTMEPRPLLDLYRLWLDQRPFASPIACLTMVASATARPTARQLSLYRQKEEKEAAALACAIARLTASFGPASVVRLFLTNTHRPEKRLGTGSPLELTGNKEVLGSNAFFTPGSRSPMVVRLLTPPRSVAWVSGVLERAGQGRARVVDIDGPHRVCGEWWEIAGWFDRSYYWLTVEDGARLWVFRDERDGRHYLHGVAD